MINWFHIVALIALLLAWYLTKKFLAPLAKRTESRIDDVLIDTIVSIIFYSALLLFVWFTFGPFAERFGFKETLARVLATIGILVVGKGVLNVLLTVLDELKAKIPKFDQTSYTIVKNVIYVLIGIAVVVSILSVWGVSIGPLLASLGIVSLAIGFALKDTLENIISGVLLFLDPPFKVGDIVEVEGQVGKVIDIGIRNTKIQRFSGDIIVIPNSKMLYAHVINYNLPDEKVRVTLKIGVSYDAEPEKVKETLLEIAKNHPKVLKDPEPEVYLVEFGDFSINYELRFWVYLSDKLKAIDEINTKIWHTFKEKGIEIPYPIYTVYLKK